MAGLVTSAHRAHGRGGASPRSTRLHATPPPPVHLQIPVDVLGGQAQVNAAPQDGSVTPAID